MSKDCRFRCAREKGDSSFDHLNLTICDRFLPAAQLAASWPGVKAERSTRRRTATSGATFAGGTPLAAIIAKQVGKLVAISVVQHRFGLSRENAGLLNSLHSSRKTLRGCGCGMCRRVYTTSPGLPEKRRTAIRLRSAARPKERIFECSVLFHTVRIA